MANFVYPLYLDRTGRIRTGANTTRVYNDGTNKLGAKFGDTYTFHLYFIDESAATYRLANPSTVKIGVKADGKFDGAVLATGSTSSYPATDADPYVIEVPFTGTGIEDLLNSGDADEDNDVAFIDAMFEVEWTEDAGTTYNSTIDPVGCRIHNDVNKTGDASPDAVPSPDDDWVAHGHAQSLTSGQQAQAQTNLGLGDAATRTSSEGGNGASDNGKVIRFNSSGGFSATASSGSAIIARANAAGAAALSGTADLANGYAVAANTAATGAYAIYCYDYTNGEIFSIKGSGAVVLGATVKTNLLAALGIPTYADLTAANAALNAGDIYFDTALGVLRSATA